MQTRDLSAAEPAVTAHAAELQACLEHERRRYVVEYDWGVFDRDGSNLRCRVLCVSHAEKAEHQ